MAEFSLSAAFDELIASPQFCADCAGIKPVSLSEKSAALLVSSRVDLSDRRKSRPILMSLVDLAMRAALLAQDRFHERALASSIRMDFFDELPDAPALVTCSVVECHDRYVGRISISPEAMQQHVSCVATCTFMR